MQRSIGMLSLLVFGPALAASVTIDFEGVVGDTDQLIPAAPYVEDSFQIIPSDFLNNGIFGKDNAMGSNSNGTAIYGWCADFFFCYPTESFTLTNIDSNPFSLMSFDASNLQSTQTAYDLVITGFYAAGGSLTTTLSLTTNSWQSFAFSSSWSGLSSVIVQASGPGDWDPAIDNIRVSAVPVPAAVWLFASGLGLLGWMKRGRS